MRHWVSVRRVTWIRDLTEMSQERSGLDGAGKTAHLRDVAVSAWER